MFVKMKNSFLRICISFATSLFLCAGVGLAQPARLPDTGQTNHFTQTFGEDSDFTGSGPSYVDNGDGTVTDLVTGLIWQKTDGGEMAWEKAKEYARNLRLGGQQDWRLPMSMDLFSILNHDRHGPAMDTHFFTRTDAQYWWTDSALAGDNSKVWLVNAGGGIGAHSSRETTSAGGDRAVHVRCVRGESPFGRGPSLRDNADGTVTDEKTGLIWQKIASDQAMTWEQALKYCGELKLAGQTDWRLPNIKELRSLSDNRKVEPSLDKTFFPKAQPASYWSSTTHFNRPQQAWFVDFKTGLVSHEDKPQPYWVLAVRGGVAVPASKTKTAPDPRLLDKPGRGRGPDGGKTKGSKNAQQQSP